MFIHDIIKINYVNEGYLPNYPYHMLTDREMFDAFLLDEEGFFAVNYPCLDEELRDAYNTLLEYMQTKIAEYLENGTELPMWIYSYMRGHTTSTNSDVRDIQELYDLTGVEQDGVEAEFTTELSKKCYEVSAAWLRKQINTSAVRPATMFGEPHVFKSLRLAQVDILGS